MSYIYQKFLYLICVVLAASLSINAYAAKVEINKTLSSSDQANIIKNCPSLNISFSGRYMQFDSSKIRTATSTCKSTVIKYKSNFGNTIPDTTTIKGTAFKDCYSCGCGLGECGSDCFSCLWFSPCKSHCSN